MMTDLTTVIAQSASASGSEDPLTYVVGVLAAVFAAALLWAQFRKTKRDGDAVVITGDQGAATLLNDIVKTLQAQIEYKDGQIQRLQIDNETLRMENWQLRSGTERRGDAKEGNDRGKA
jgi:hypothetical protein